eukprot:Nitzschia sp. Nitz4//scaffold68_size99682//37058//38488//NITZ4_004563-RA/size99682-processed-gene-0.20-mRNA-1//1//CDS//3329556590//7970//frame0
MFHSTNVILLISITALLGPTLADDAATCEIEGVTYERGENLGNAFITRCGPASVYPCYCNPDLKDQAECPYCGFALEGGGVLCGKDGESYSFVDVDGLDQTCSCSAPLGGTAVSDCSVDQIDTKGTCSFQLSDGGYVSFESGESVAEYLPSDCGDSFPCYCDPDAEDQLSCPFCIFTTITGEKVCAGDEDNVEFFDELGVEQECICFVSSSGSTLSSCSEVGSTPSPSLSGFCTLEADGIVHTVANGDSYGDLLVTRCGLPSDYPCYCDTSLPSQVYCPYCGFFNSTGGLVCAKDGETVEYLEGDTTTTCSCEVPDDSSEGVIKTCENDPTAAPTTLTGCVIADSSGDPVVIDDGASFGNLIEGECGEASNWPAYCNLDVSTSASELADHVEYPYCVFTDTLAGEVFCASDGQQITYVDDTGATLNCLCTYYVPSLGGPQSDCRVVDNSSDSDSDAAPARSHRAIATVLLWWLYVV